MLTDQYQAQVDTIKNNNRLVLDKVINLTDYSAAATQVQLKLYCEILNSILQIFH